MMDEIRKVRNKWLINLVKEVPLPLTAPFKIELDEDTEIEMPTKEKLYQTNHYARNSMESQAGSDESVRPKKVQKKKYKKNPEKNHFHASFVQKLFQLIHKSSPTSYW